MGDPIPLVKREDAFARVWIAAPLLALAALLLRWCVSDDLGDLGGDSATYLLTAKAIAGANPLWSHVAAQSQFPPLYPMLLAISGGAWSLPAAHSITALCLVGACALLYAWLLGQRLTPMLAGSIAIAGVCVPGLWLLLLQLRSEFLYLLLSIAALVVMERIAARGRSMALLAALLVAAAMLTRSIGIALVLPLAIAAMPLGWRALALTLALALGPQLAWHLAHHPGAGYGDALVANYSEHPFAVLGAQIASEVRALRDGFAQAFLQRTSFVLGDALLVVLLGTSLLRAWRGRADGLYVVAYVAVILVWPYGVEASRFLLPIIPLWIAQLALVRRAAPAVLILFVVFVAPAWLDLSTRYANAGPEARHLPEWYSSSRARAQQDVAAHAMIVTAMRETADEMPADACVIAVKPTAVVFYADRLALYPPATTADDASFDRELRATGCRFVLLMPFASGRSAEPFYPQARLRDRLTGVQQWSIADDRGNAIPVAILATIDR